MSDFKFEIQLDLDDMGSVYAAACNAVFRSLYPEWDDPEDPTSHTSDEAREVATRVLTDIGITLSKRGHAELEEHSQLNADGFRRYRASEN